MYYRNEEKMKPWQAFWIILAYAVEHCLLVADVQEALIAGYSLDYTDREAKFSLTFREENGE